MVFRVWDFGCGSEFLWEIVCVELSAFMAASCNVQQSVRAYKRDAHVEMLQQRSLVRSPLFNFLR